jgi:hypothetical protein
VTTTDKLGDLLGELQSERIELETRLAFTDDYADVLQYRHRLAFVDRAVDALAGLVAYQPLDF